MFQPRSINGIPEGSPPPIPPRNPLRNDAPHLEKEYPLPPQDDDGAAMSQGRPTLHMIAESSLENVDTCLEFASPRHANKEAMLDGPSLRRGPQPDRAPHRLSVMSDDGESASLVSVRSSWTNGLRRLSSVLDGRTAPSVQNPGIGSKMQHNIEQAMANLQSKLVDAESLTTISSYDGGSTLENINNNDEENTRIKAWLQRGTMDGQSLPSACTSQTDGTPKSPATKNPPAISIFPPMSPNTGKREYICPSSPLNNGRDAYGNYIPTNTQDYMTARHIPSSPQSPFDVEDTCSYGQDSTSAARLRGGGGWWNALGIGFDEKESSEVKQNELAASEASRKQTPVQSLRVKRYFGSPSQYSGKTPSDGGGSYVGTALVREMSDTTSHQPLRPMLANNHHNPRSTAGHILNDHSLTTDLTPQYTSPRTHGNDNHAPASPRQRPWPSYDAHASSAYPSASKAFPKVSKTAESPWSGVSFTPRANKKWNQEPASGPPSSVVMPPPPLVQHTYTDSDVVSSVGMLSPSKYRYERQPSLAESYDDQAWELQSLQLGESVSVAGGPRRTVGGMSRPRTARFDPEEFEAAQKIAQVEFRPLCQDIMTRYNAEMSRNQRELKEGRMTAEQYKRQMDFLVQNKDRSLKHSAESTGYVVSIHPSIFNVSSRITNTQLSTQEDTQCLDYETMMCSCAPRSSPPNSQSSNPFPHPTRTPSTTTFSPRPTPLYGDPSFSNTMSSWHRPCIPHRPSCRVPHHSTRRAMSQVRLRASFSLPLRIRSSRLIRRERRRRRKGQRKDWV